MLCRFIIDALCLFVDGTFPVVGLDVIFHPPAPELCRMGAEQAPVGDTGMELEPVDQVVDVVVTGPWVVVKEEGPQEVEVLQHAVLEVPEAVVGQVEVV